MNWQERWCSYGFRYSIHRVVFLSILLLIRSGVNRFLSNDNWILDTLIHSNTERIGKHAILLTKSSCPTPPSPLPSPLESQTLSHSMRVWCGASERLVWREVQVGNLFPLSPLNPAQCRIFFCFYHRSRLRPRLSWEKLLGLWLSLKNRQEKVLTR